MALCLSLCVCVSITSRCSVKTAEQIGLVFGMGASFDLILLSNFAPQPHFCHSISIGKSCYQLRLRKVDAQSTMNWVVVDQVSW